MPSYEITPGSVESKDDHTRLRVTYINDDAVKSEEQNFEIKSTDEVAVYRALDAGAESFNKLLPTSVAPSLITGKSLEVGVEAEKETLIRKESQEEL